MSAKPGDVISEPILLREEADGIVTLTLNRPGLYNALSRALLSELQTALDEISADTSIRVVIIAARVNAF